MRIALWFWATVFIAMIAWGLASYDYLHGAVIALLGALLSLAMMLRVAWGTWVTLSHLFVLFFTFYTLSAPIELLFGSGELPPFSPPYAIREWLCDASVSVACLTGGMAFLRLIGQPRDVPVNNLVDSALIAQILMLLASLGELSNIWRAGGLSVLFAPKAVYQAATSDVPVTVPSSTIALVAFALIGFYCAQQQTLRLSAPLRHFGLLALPLIFVHIVMGQRLELASYMLTFVLAVSYRRNIVRLPTRWFVLGLSVYVLMSSLYAFRWVFPMWLAGQKISVPAGTALQSLVKALNPALSEFGGSFGNYSTFLQSGHDDLRWGETYLRDMTIVVPGFLYPGEKPQSVTYEFRDKYFGQWAERSRIAGTAFSSLLEARMNFGDIGPLLVFYCQGLFLALLEWGRCTVRSPWYALLYATFAQFALVVHRSSTAGTLSGYMLVLGTLGLAWTLSLALRGVARWKFHNRSASSSSSIV